MTEVDKPAELAGRGGAWFRSYDAAGAVSAEIHVGVEDPVRPRAQGAPGAACCDDVDELEATGARLESLGFDVDWRERRRFPGYQRFHTLRRRSATGSSLTLL